MYPGADQSRFQRVPVAVQFQSITPEATLAGHPRTVPTGARPPGNRETVPSHARACPGAVGDRPRTVGLVRLLKIATVEVSPP